jgi:hypothetical protein
LPATNNKNTIATSQSRILILIVGLSDPDCRATGLFMNGGFDRFGAERGLTGLSPDAAIRRRVETAMAMPAYRLL